VHACNSTSRTTRVIHRSTVSVYLGTFTLPTNRRQLPIFLPPFKITPFYRRGLQVTCWISPPRPLSAAISPFTYDLLFLQSYLFLRFFLSLPCFCVRVCPKRSQPCHVSISFSHCSLMFACLFGGGGWLVKYKLYWQSVSPKTIVTCCKLRCRGITGGRRHPARVERKSQSTSGLKQIWQFLSWDGLLNVHAGHAFVPV